MIIVGHGKVGEVPVGNTLGGLSLDLIVVFEHEIAAQDNWDDYRRAELETRLLPDGKIIRAIDITNQQEATVSTLSDLIERTYVETVHGNTNAATRYLEEARTAIRNADKHNPDILAERMMHPVTRALIQMTVYLEKGGFGGLELLEAFCMEMPLTARQQVEVKRSANIG